MIDFSVLMSTYRGDDPAQLLEALLSIDCQSVRPTELVLMVDGLVTPEINIVIENFSNETSLNLIIIRCSENRGLAQTLREGVLHCTYDLIARMDADDISVVDRFEKQILEFEQQPGLQMVGGSILEFSDLHSETNQRLTPETYEEIKRTLLFRSPFNHVTVMFRKEMVLSVGNYKDFRGIEDLGLWFDVVNHTKLIKNITDVLVEVRVNPDFINRRSGYKYAKQEFRVYKYAYDEGYISLSEFISVIVFRTTFRMLPKLFISRLYKLKRRYE